MDYEMVGTNIWDFEHRLSDLILELIVEEYWEKLSYYLNTSKGTVLDKYLIVIAWHYPKVFPGAHISNNDI